ncbi:MAG: hypothetical protein E7661_01485 [Ruminococcaceae bacterium]|nr:hypothetical protein [Oscillospiraceae bacterium]
MNTIKFDKADNPVKMVGHQGLYGLETGNTCAGFVAAGNRSYWGIECDIHVTADGQFAVIHDDNTMGVSGEDFEVEKTDLATLRSITLFDRDGWQKTREDLKIPTLREYIRICRKYEKYAVCEIKNPMTPKNIARAVNEVQDEGWLEKTVFISFSHHNMVELRRLLPSAKLMYLTTESPTEALLEKLLPWHLDLDIAWTVLTREGVELMHKHGLEVNVWNVDDKELATRLCEWGVDYITSNILE